ncbi:hypothetical protein [Thalassovita mediterranea]|uniref:hypothetical protein n=1 Tax=Thalassovita mediterranea TaxID=340021 RepID=UPI00071DD63B|nr:hypothetical protein [Thalassovita mediterranea]
MWTRIRATISEAFDILFGPILLLLFLSFVLLIVACVIGWIEFDFDYWSIRFLAVIMGGYWCYASWVFVRAKEFETLAALWAVPVVFGIYAGFTYVLTFTFDLPKIVTWLVGLLLGAATMGICGLLASHVSERLKALTE